MHVERRAEQYLLLVSVFYNRLMRFSRFHSVTGPCVISRRAFWGSWGASPKSSQPKRAPSILSKVVPPGVKGGKPFSTPSANVPKGSVSMAEALNPARIAAAMDYTSGETPSTEQQRLIDAGLELLEKSKLSDVYTVSQLQALGSVVELVFSDSLSSTLPVFEQFQIVMDGFLAFRGGEKSSSMPKSFLSISEALFPPDLNFIFYDASVADCLSSGAAQIAFCSYVRLALGEGAGSLQTWLAGADADSREGCGHSLQTEGGHETKECVDTDLIVSFNKELHTAVLSLDGSDGGDSAPVMRRLLAILLDHAPGLQSHQTFFKFSQMSAERLRLHCRYVQVLAQLFEAFDPEGSGKIPLNLLQESLGRVGTKEQTQQLLSSAVPDGNGDIDYPVLIKMLRNIRH